LNIDANRDDEYVTTASDVQFSIVEFVHLINRYVVQWSRTAPLLLRNGQ
jgi:hypothetical protein